MKKILNSIYLFFATAGVSAMAALPDEVTTALNTAKTDLVAVGGLILAIVAGLYVFKKVPSLLR